MTSQIDVRISSASKMIEKAAKTAVLAHVCPQCPVVTILPPCSHLCAIPTESLLWNWEAGRTKEVGIFPTLRCELCRAKIVCLGIKGFYLSGVSFYLGLHSSVSSFLQIWAIPR